MQPGASLMTLSSAVRDSCAALKASGFKGLLKIALASIATPSILSKSPRFGVKSSSMTSSSRFKAAKALLPISAFSGKWKIPSWYSSGTNLFSRPSSLREQIMPFDSTPRILARFILKPPGSSAPSFATITCWPALTFGAPQTIWSFSFPTST